MLPACRKLHQHRWRPIDLEDTPSWLMHAQDFCVPINRGTMLSTCLARMVNCNLVPAACLVTTGWPARERARNPKNGMKSCRATCPRACVRGQEPKDLDNSDQISIEEGSLTPLGSGRHRLVDLSSSINNQLGCYSSSRTNAM